jgi:hypothetical protein
MSFETFMSAYKTALRHNPEDHIRAVRKPEIWAGDHFKMFVFAGQLTDVYNDSVGI